MGRKDLLMPKVSSVVLTDRKVLSAKAEAGGRLELWDARIPGLCLRVAGSGKKTWVVRYRTADGRQPRLTLGSAGDNPGDLRLVDARDRAVEVRRQAREGLDPSSGGRRKAKPPAAVVIGTLNELAEDYFLKCERGLYKARRTRKKASTIAGERRLWARHLEPGIGRLAYPAVTRNDVREALAAIAAVAPIYSNRARALVRAIYNFAIREDLVTGNPVAGVSAIADETPRERTLDDDEIRKVWRALEDPTGLSLVERGEARPLMVGEAVRIALRLSFLTIQRRGEVAGMRRSELRLDEGLWIIAKERAKNGKAHVVPLSSDAVALVRTALRLHPPSMESDAVFPSPKSALLGQPIDGGALSHALSDVFSAVGVKGATLHDLRRTGASIMVSERLSVPPVVVSRILNHSLDAGGAAAVTFRHYAIYDYAAEKRAALDAWAKLLRRIVAASSRPSRPKSVWSA